VKKGKYRSPREELASYRRLPIYSNTLPHVFPLFPTEKYISDATAHEDVTVLMMNRAVSRIGCRGRRAGPPVFRWSASASGGESADVAGGLPARFTLSLWLRLPHQPVHDTGSIPPDPYLCASEYGDASAFSEFGQACRNPVKQGGAGHCHRRQESFRSARG
jgi:hypothetical protein